VPSLSQTLSYAEGGIMDQEIRADIEGLLKDYNAYFCPDSRQIVLGLKN
jgi:hypothetical protein